MGGSGHHASEFGSKRKGEASEGSCGKMQRRWLRLFSEAKNDFEERSSFHDLHVALSLPWWE